MTEESKQMDVLKMAYIIGCNEAKDVEGKGKGGIEVDAKHRINMKERLHFSKAR